MSLRTATGWMPAPVPAYRPATEECIYIDARGECTAEPYIFQSDREVFLDGSGQFTDWPCWRTAGAAAVQLDADGAILGGAALTLPRHWPQTAAAGERAALDLATSHGAPGARFPGASDCKSVVTESQQAYRQMAWDRPWSGIWKSLHRRKLAGGAGFSALRHVKAHRDLAEAPATDRVAIFGNDRADHFAKRAAWKFVSEAERDERLQLGSEAVAFYKGLARLLAAWPKAKDLYGPLEAAGSTAPPGSGPQRRGTQHEFSWRKGTTWQCVGCFRVVRSPAQLRRWQRRRDCSQPGGAAQNLLAAPRGHHLWLARTSRRERIIICARCGRHAEDRTDLLRGPCLGSLGTTAARRAHSRFFSLGIHPDPRQGQMRLEDVGPANTVCRGWASRLRQDYAEPTAAAAADRHGATEAAVPRPPRGSDLDLAEPPFWGGQDEEDPGELGLEPPDDADAYLH